MEQSNQTNPKNIFLSAAQEKEAQQTVSAILDQIPDLLKVKQVRKSDGSSVDFQPEVIGCTLEQALEGAKLDDRVLLARMTYQVLAKIDRQYDGHTVPTTADIDRLIGIVLIDNNLPHAARTFLDAQAPTVEKGEHYSDRGLRFHRRFTKAGTHPYDDIEWESRDAVIADAKGKPVFEQRDVEIPKSWSQGATNIVVSKYFRGELGKPERESSVKQMVDRVAQTIAKWGREGGYFATQADAQVFEDELTAILVNQRAAFNSPVWFNVGITERPQCSACFINSVRDDLRSILNLAVTEGMLFKYGSGTGSNLSTLRSSKEKLSNSSGKSSGPVSFMKGYDAFAGVIKSGGKTRRAAKMVILNAEHPDIMEYINCKRVEEHKAKALVEMGYDPSMDGDAYSSIYFQNANNSVRVTDDFMRAVIEDKEWKTRAVTSGETVEVLRARNVMKEICDAAWECGDPGMQYDTTVNRWNPVANSGRINGSNPCSEYMFLDDTSCNLASLNLMKFRQSDGAFDVDAFKHAVEVMITAQEILVDNSSYPTPAITQNSYDYRPLGLGYANLGALLMSRGLAYDSDEGRNLAAAITSLMSGHAYFQSARMAEATGAFAFYKMNERPFLKVIGLHRDHAYAVPATGVEETLLNHSRQAWDNALEFGMSHGFKNAQISVLAPTGTIGFLMDCDTTGIEPDIALIKYKWLVGGGLMKIVNNTVSPALERLGYSEAERADIIAYLDKNDTIEGAPHLKEADLPVFDCAFKPANGRRSIKPMGHIRMMGAVQPFLSGAISKTVNMPETATSAEIEEVYVEGWKLGLKAIAIYRDGSKGQQALSTSKDEKKAGEGKGKTAAAETAPAPAVKAADEVKETAPAPAAEKLPTPVETRIEYRPLRRRLSDERRSVTHKFSVAGHSGFITVGLYDDGQPGEIFLRMSKGGSVISGLMDAFAISTSIALQYGVPLKVLVNKFAHVRFEPSGFTTNENIRIAKSLVDYIFRWLAMRFLPVEDQMALGVKASDDVTLGDVAKADADSSAEDSYDASRDDSDRHFEELDGSVDGGEVGDPVDNRQTKLTDALESRPDSADGGSDSLTRGFDVQSDAPPCDTCGALMVRNGACYKCLNCGSTSGCS
jgi:ribonucleoside-diphosphate reductase alpha chain